MIALGCRTRLSCRGDDVFDSSQYLLTGSLMHARACLAGIVFT